MQTIKLANGWNMRYCPECKVMYYGKEDCDCDKTNELMG